MTLSWLFVLSFQSLRIQKTWKLVPSTLSKSVSETRTATGSELISLLTRPHTTTFTLLSIFWPLKISSRKIWKTLRSKHAKCSLPVAVRVSETLVLKLPIIDHRRRQNVVRTLVTHLATPRVPLICSYHILTSSVICYWTNARQHGIYLLSRRRLT